MANEDNTVHNGQNPKRDGYIASRDAEYSNSTEVQEIIGTIPHWILRYGIMLMFLVIAGIVTGTYFIEYPDTLQAKIVITAQNPPTNIVAKTNGKLTTLLVTDNQSVTQNQLLGIIENTANYDSIELLKQRLAGFSFADNAIMGSFFKEGDLNTLFLGEEVGAAYQSFFTALKEYQFALSDLSIKNKISNTESQIQYQQKLQEKLEIQANMANQKLKLEEKRFNADKTLYEGKVMAPIEYSESQKKLLDFELNNETAGMSIIQNKLSIEQLRQAIINLGQQDVERRKNGREKLRETYHALLNAVQTWEQKYVLKATQSGKITFLKFWTTGQDVAQNDPVFTIVSPNQQIFGKASVPIYKSAKMKIGQRVNIRLANYPFEQYGILVGQVAGISQVPLQDNYLITVSLPNGLTTSYKRNLIFYPEMKGDAQVVLKKERLLTKLFFKYREINDGTN